MVHILEIQSHNASANYFTLMQRPCVKTITETELCLYQVKKLKLSVFPRNLDDMKPDDCNLFLHVILS